MDTTFIFSLVATIISILSLIISCRQNNRQNSFQKKENQPIFDIKSHVISTKKDGVYDTDVLEIKNIGREASSIEKIELVTFINLKISLIPKEKILYIPIYGYYVFSYNQERLVGDIMTNITTGNNSDYFDFYMECLNNSKDLLYYNSDLLKFVVIHYTDIYDEKHVVYFESGKKCSEEYYLDVVQKSKEVFKWIEFDIHKLKLEDLQDYIKIEESTK